MLMYNKNIELLINSNLYIMLLFLYFIYFEIYEISLIWFRDHCMSILVKG